MSLMHQTVSAPQTAITPFLKWAGGKRWLAKSMKDLIGEVRGCYFEPFLGSGAVYFSVRPDRALLSDANKELIETYNAVKTHPAEVALALANHHDKHGKSHYYDVRSEIPENEIDRAARFIYLNRTCWNGLYRVNMNGQFNVPIGTKSAVQLDSDDFGAVAASLAPAQLLSCDFENSLSLAGVGDVVFCDPPYTVLHNNNGFVKYNEKMFSWEDQIRLRDCVVDAKNRGARIFLTNADHDSVRDLYANEFEFFEQERFSSIGGAKANRGMYAELLIMG